MGGITAPGRVRECQVTFTSFLINETFSCYEFHIWKKTTHFNSDKSIKKRLDIIQNNEKYIIKIGLYQPSEMLLVISLTTGGTFSFF